MTNVLGALLGAVVGDAFGAPLEGISASDARRAAERRAGNRGPWRYTDDAAMFIAVAETLRDAGTIEPIQLLTRLRAHYEPARGFGRGMKLALKAFEAGTSWQDVAHAAWPGGSRGNGGAVRAAAVALRPWATHEDLLAAIHVATRVTHAHPEALELAALHGTLVAITLSQPDLLDRPGSLLDALAQRLPDTALTRECLADLRQAGTQALRRTSPLARESVVAAHASFLRVHGTFEDAVVHAASLGGDVDSICCMVGCLAGALHGANGIPSAWRASLDGERPSLDALASLADAIAAMPPAAFAKTDDVG